VIETHRTFEIHAIEPSEPARLNARRWRGTKNSPASGSRLMKFLAAADQRIAIWIGLFERGFDPFKRSFALFLAAISRRWLYLDARGALDKLPVRQCRRCRDGKYRDADAK
jgi:hypothetical protein